MKMYFGISTPDIQSEHCRECVFVCMKFKQETLILKVLTVLLSRAETGVTVFTKVSETSLCVFNEMIFAVKWISRENITTKKSSDGMIREGESHRLLCDVSCRVDWMFCSPSLITTLHVDIIPLTDTNQHCSILGQRWWANKATDKTFKERLFSNYFTVLSDEAEVEEQSKFEGPVRTSECVSHPFFHVNCYQAVHTKARILSLIKYNNTPWNEKALPEASS